MTLEEFTALVNNPLYRRLLEIGRDVKAGLADDETVRAWEDYQETVQRVQKAAERATARFEPKDRERVLRGWVEEAMERRQTAALMN